MKKADAILTADWHIRASRPLCRTDDFISAMWGKVEFILGLAQEYACPIIIAGDIGETAQWSDWLLEKFLDLVNKYKTWIEVIAGQHDLPNHNLAEIRKSGIGVLYQNNHICECKRAWDQKISLLGFNFGEKIIPQPPLKEHGYRCIAVTHQMILKDGPLWPGQVAPTARNILKQYPGYDLIVSGDNHNTFTEEYEGRLLINPGSLTRHKADQINHKPCVFLWNAEKNEIEQVFIPIEQGVIDRSHIEKQKDKEQVEMAFVERMNQDYDLDLSYEENMRRYFTSNRVHSEVEKKVWSAINE